MTDHLFDADISCIKPWRLRGTHRGRVVRCYDGDTLSIAVLVNDTPYVFGARLYGIDAPEMCPSNGTEVQKHCEKRAAVRARNRVLQLVTDGDIDVGAEYSAKDIDHILESNRKPVTMVCKDMADKYGRTLCELFVNSLPLSVNEILVREGYAVAYGVDGTLTKRPFVCTA